MADKFLIIGNGFDLAHGLPTRYSDFLNFIKVMPQLRDKYKNDKNYIGKDMNPIEPPNKIDVSEEDIQNLYDYLKSILDRGEFSILMNDEYKNIFEENSFIKAFLNCFEIKKKCESWIDLESEIKLIIEVMLECFKLNGERRFDFLKNKYPTYIHESMGKYFASDSMDNDCFLNEYYIRSDINDSSRLWIELKKELDEVKKILALYLHLMTKNNKYKENINIIKSIIEYGMCVINFNYTSTIEKIYNDYKFKIQYIHGKLPEDIFCWEPEKNKADIILGMPDLNDKDLHTIYFKKFFQRIQYKTGIEYKKWFSEDRKYNIIFYGHSMDKNDGDIIKYVILNSKNEKTTIYYVNQEDYETKVINLIEILEKDTFEKMYYDGKIEFKTVN